VRLPSEILGVLFPDDGLARDVSWCIISRVGIQLDMTIEKPLHDAPLTVVLLVVPSLAPQTCRRMKILAIRWPW
jgi:hypothetical protein